MLFKDYQLLVREDYEKKRAKNALSLRLMNPTAAKLRDECYAVCQERYAGKDEQTLSTFFGKQQNPTAYTRTIKIENPDRFRPLMNFLKDKVSDPDLITVELLAWLIDFKSRPFRLGMTLNDDNTEVEHIEEVTQIAEKQNSEEEESKITAVSNNNDSDDDDNSGDDNGNNGKTRSKFEMRVAVVLAFLIISIGMGAYWLLNHNLTGWSTNFRSGEGCMYWAGDHYQAVPCNQKFDDGTLVIGLDSERLNHFKKITTPDTITERSKGSVWYAKIDNKIEFYTSGGTHPIHVEKTLKPVTHYIIYKYILINRGVIIPHPLNTFY